MTEQARRPLLDHQFRYMTPDRAPVYSKIVSALKELPGSHLSSLTHRSGGQLLIKLTGSPRDFDRLETVVSAYETGRTNGLERSQIGQKMDKAFRRIAEDAVLELTNPYYAALKSQRLGSL